MLELALGIKSFFLDSSSLSAIEDLDEAWKQLQIFSHPNLVEYIDLIRGQHGIAFLTSERIYLVTQHSSSTLRNAIQTRSKAGRTFALEACLTLTLRKSW